MTLWRRTRTPAAGGTGGQFGTGARLAAVWAFGVLAVAGAVGSYFAVVNGIGSLLGEPVGAEPYPLAATAPHDAGGEQANSGLGGGTAAAEDRHAAPGAPVPGTVRVLPTTTPTTAAGTEPQSTGPQSTAPPATTPSSGSPDPLPTDCDCLTPPVPTPTQPAPAPSEPAPTTTEPVPPPDSPSATPSPTDSPDDSGSPEPSASPGSPAPAGSDSAAGPDEDEAGARHARRH